MMGYTVLGYTRKWSPTPSTQHVTAPGEITSPDNDHMSYDVVSGLHILYLLIYRLGPKLPSSTTFTNTDSLHDLADGTFVGNMTVSKVPGA